MNRATFFSAVSFAVPNIVLAVGLLALVLNDLSVLAFLLALLSKWQILLGGPRLWLNNLRANLCDITVTLSFVSLLIFFNQLALQLILTQIYVVWLLVLKPLSSPTAVAVQAGVCQFLGVTVVFLLATRMPFLVLLAAVWVVSAIAADHTLRPHEEPARGILIATWSLLAVELGWILHRWLVLYPLGGSGFIVPQASLLITLLGYTLASLYLDHRKKNLNKGRMALYSGMLFLLVLVIILQTQWNVRV